jgi:uncharacterized protein
VPSLRRAATAVPRAVRTRAEKATRSAVGNARAAASGISAQVAERRALDPDAAEEGPGSLTRIPEDDCLALLDGRSVGRLAYVARPGMPDIVPVNYARRGRDVLVRSGAGPKLQAAERGENMALEVDEIDDTTHAGWSVVVVGPARRLSEQEAEDLPDGVLPETWAKGPRSAVLQLTARRVAGRRLG